MRRNRELHVAALNLVAFRCQKEIVVQLAANAHRICVQTLQVYLQTL